MRPSRVSRAVFVQEKCVKLWSFLIGVYWLDTTTRGSHNVTSWVQSVQNNNTHLSLTFLVIDVVYICWLSGDLTAAVFHHLCEKNHMIIISPGASLLIPCVFKTTPHSVIYVIFRDVTCLMWHCVIPCINCHRNPTWADIVEEKKNQEKSDFYLVLLIFVNVVVIYMNVFWLGVDQYGFFRACTNADE